MVVSFGFLLGIDDDEARFVAPLIVRRVLVGCFFMTICRRARRSRD
jgi:hypothetical protein